ncbi:MAG: GbsR/MarR family transcriptional regulator [Luteolibacter sp.]
MDSSPQTLETRDGQLSALQQQIVDFFVDGVKVLGLPRSLGEIYGLLYISPTPLALDDLVALLGISKGSASQGLRTLRGLGAVREVPRHGDRRAYYEPAVELKRLAGGFIREQIRPHLDSGSLKLRQITETASLSTDPVERKFFNERVDRIEKWIKRGKQVLPVLQKILGE